MGLGCGEEWRQKHPRWCSLLDGVIGTTWAAAPDTIGVAAVGTAALDPAGPTAVILMKVKKYNLDMFDQGKDGMDPVWAGQHPMEALRELKRRGY